MSNCSRLKDSKQENLLIQGTVYSEPKWYPRQPEVYRPPDKKPWPPYNPIKNKVELLVKEFHTMLQNYIPAYRD